MAPNKPFGRTSSVPSTSPRTSTLSTPAPKLRLAIRLDDADDQAADDRAADRVEPADDGAGQRAKRELGLAERREPAERRAQQGGGEPDSMPADTHAKRYTWLTGTPSSRATVGSPVVACTASPNFVRVKKR